MPSSRRKSGVERTWEGGALREMRESDLPQVLEIERDAYPTPWTRSHFQFEIRDNAHAINLVLVTAGHVIGYVCCWRLGPELKINNVAVCRSRRGTGAGKVLLDGILRRARELGCSEATLEVRPSNEAARRLYDRFGFRQVGVRPGYYQDTREDGLLLTLQFEE